MKILHIENTARVPYILASAQRSLGDDAAVLETWRRYDNIPHDLENYYEGNYFEKLLKMRKTVRIARNYDVIHVHSGIAIRRLDIVYLGFTRPLVVHYHGSETRQGYGMYYRSLAKKKIVSTPDLLRWHEDAVFIPNPCPVNEQYLRDNKSPSEDMLPVVIHMPTNPKLKGTDLIVAAIKELEKELDFRFILIMGKPHEEAMRELSKAWILIDQVVDYDKSGLPGLFGMVSLEAMSMGKAVISHVDSEMMSYYPGCPIVNTKVDKEDLKEKIRYLITNPEEVKRLGELGIRYVRENHDPIKIARRIRKIYEEII